MKNLAAVALFSCMVALGGCANSVGDDGSSADVGPTDPTSGNGNPGGGSTTPLPGASTALFQPLQGVLPYPTDLYFSGTTDGTLNIGPASALQPNQAAVNALDGFSTTAPIRARFGGALDATSLTAATVRVIEVNIDNATKATVGVRRLLTLGTDFSVGLATDGGVGNQIVEIKPLKPLTPSTGATNIGYLVLLTNGIRDAAGNAAVPDADYASIKGALGVTATAPAVSTPTCPAITNPTVNGICRLTGAHLSIANAVGAPANNVVLSFSFSTQATRDTLDALNAQIMAGPASTYTIANTGLTTAAISPLLPGIARIYAGTLRITYYLSAPSAGDPTAPLTKPWQAAGASPVPGIDPASRNLTRFNPIPGSTAQLDIPLLLTVPTVGAPGPNGWPIAIFQHGTPRSRGDALLVADSLAAAGFATIAIDLPLHGITNAPTETFAALRQAGRERTFDVDYVNNATSAAGPDGAQDPTGTHYINLTAPLVSRDNVRQSVVDIVRLIRTIPTIDFDANGTPDFDGNRIHLVAYSAGAIVGTTVLGINSQVKASALPMGAVGLIQTLQESSFYGPRINAALAAGGLTPGTTLYNQWFRDVTTVVDAGDGANFASTATQGGTRKIHVFYVVGGAPNPAGGTWGADDTVPNSRTQVLTSLLNLPTLPTGVTGTVPITGNGIQVRLNSGIHNSLLDPRPSAAVTSEMQRQIASFVATNGAAVVVTDPTVIAP